MSLDVPCARIERPHSPRHGIVTIWERPEVARARLVFEDAGNKGVPSLRNIQVQSGRHNGPIWHARSQWRATSGTPGFGWLWLTGLCSRAARIQRNAVRLHFGGVEFGQGVV